MTEFDEIAENLAQGYSAWLSLSHGSTLELAREYARKVLHDESEQVIDNVAWALHHNRR